MGPRAKAEEAPKGAGKEKRKDSERRRACFRSFNHLSKSEILKRRSQDELLFRCRTCFSSRSESCYDECATFVECLNQMGLGQLHFFCSCLLFFCALRMEHVETTRSSWPIAAPYPRWFCPCRAGSWCVSRCHAQAGSRELGDDGALMDCLLWKHDCGIDSGGRSSALKLS